MPGYLPVSFSEYDVLPREGRRGASLAIVFLLLALVTTAFAFFPPFPDSPQALDAALAVALVLLAVASLLVVPRAGRWALDALLTCAWLSVALLTSTRPAAAGPAGMGALLLIIALYTAYFTTGRRFAFHLIGMCVAYATVRMLHSGPGSLFFTIVTMTLVSVVALLFHRLKSVDRRFQLLVENSADVILLSCNDLIEWISPSVTKVFGWEPVELVGWSTDRLWHPEDVDSATQQRQRAYSGGTSTALLRGRHKDGHDLWIECSAKPLGIRGAAGSIKSLRDVTARVLAEQELRRRERLERESAQKQARIAEAKANLFQNLSHELRTPLAIMGGPLLDLQRHGDLSAAEHANLSAAIRASARLERLVDGLLDIARGQADGLGSVAEPTDLAAITRGTANMFSELAHGLGIDLRVRLEAIPPRVMIDPEAWITILVNLVSNAIKFTEHGSVTVAVHYEQSQAHLRVSDTGVGIPEDDLPNVFDRYERAPKRAVHGETGSGIGLSLVAELLRANGGRSAISSEVGVGTTVEVWIPADVCEPVATADSAHHLDLAARQHAWAWEPPSVVSDVAPSASTSVLRGRILVVEDNVDLRGYLARLLREDGWEVTEAADVPDAMPHIGTHDLLLSDVMLPGSSGIDLVRAVRESEDESRWMPIILLTARADNTSVIEGLTAGADDYVTKPFSPAELLARIGTHVELSFLRQIVLDQANGRAANLEKALGSNRMIGTALGIIMATERVSADEAFDRLRTASQHSNRKLRDVADDVIYTGAMP